MHCVSLCAEPKVGCRLTQRDVAATAQVELGVEYSGGGSLEFLRPCGMLEESLPRFMCSDSSGGARVSATSLRHE